MKFSFKNEIKASELLLVTLKRTYRSPVGVINIVFTVAMVALLVAFAGKTSTAALSFIIVGLLWFPVIQPILIYLGHKKTLSSLPKNMELKFDDNGMQVIATDKKEKIGWAQVKRMTVDPDLLILYTDEKYGYILTNRVLGDQREAFLEFAKENLKRTR